MKPLRRNLKLVIKDICVSCILLLLLLTPNNLLKEKILKIPTIVFDRMSVPWIQESVQVVA